MERILENGRIATILISSFWGIQPILKNCLVTIICLLGCASENVLSVWTCLHTWSWEHFLRPPHELSHAKRLSLDVAPVAKYIVHSYPPPRHFFLGY